MALDYPEETFLRNNQRIINDILKQKASLEINNFSLKEDFKNDCSHVSLMLQFKEGKTNEKFKINNTGSGVIDALFTGVIDQFLDTYISLQDITLYDFIVSVDFKESKSMFKTDAPVEVKIVLQGTSRPHNKLYFKAKSNSIVKSAIAAVCAGMEYLINAELAVVQLSKDMKSAEKRKRRDLQETYLSQLFEFINFVSYAEVINKLNEE
jgi:hypothetical protein